MYSKEKTDSLLGKMVNEFLLKNNVETPMIDFQESKDNKFELIKNNFNSIMEVLGLDLKDDSLKDTPRRITKMFLDELFWGLNYDNFPKITTVENKMQYDEMVIEKNIKVMSVCEHHFVTIFGQAHIAYIPNEKVVGLSKINRIVEFFSRRPQIQERLTEQIYYAMQYILDTENVAVVINAEHFCVKSRGVEDINSSTITSKMGGTFKKDGRAKKEFLNLIKLS